MSESKATITWATTATPNDFTKGHYSREHVLTFDGGVSIPGSASPSVIPRPWSEPSAVDPEEAFVASIASCHMLSFLYVAAAQGFAASSYRDTAVGRMSKGANGVPWVSTVRLQPELTWSGDRRPTEVELAELHHHAHEQCFIANSIKTEVTVEAVRSSSPS
jgi:organic hydroperoxide reductase OsmC/OhrA